MNLHSIKHKWISLSDQEQRTVRLGAMVLFAVFFYAAIWSPYLTHVNLLRQRIQVQEKTLHWMQAADVQIKKAEAESHPQHKPAQPVELLSLLQKAVHQAGLDKALADLKQTNNDVISLRFNKVEFDKLIRFLTVMVKKHGITISQFSANAEGTSGVVNAELLLGQ